LSAGVVAVIFISFLPFHNSFFHIYLFQGILGCVFACRSVDLANSRVQRVCVCVQRELEFKYEQKKDLLNWHKTVGKGLIRLLLVLDGWKGFEGLSIGFCN
jgi:hypothetical protein